MGTVADTGDLTGQDCAIASCGGVGGYGNCLGMAGECDCGVCDEPLPGGYVCAPECQVDCDCEYPNGDMDFTPRCLGGHCYLECTDAKPCLPEMMCTPSMVDPTTDICVW